MRLGLGRQDLALAGLGLTVRDSGLVVMITVSVRPRDRISKLLQ